VTPPRASARRAPAVVVTGVSGDLGPAVVRALWARGARVYGVYGRSRAAARALVDEARRADRLLHADSIDLLDPSGARRAARRIARDAVRAFGGVDAFVGLAGYSARAVWRRPLAELTPRLLEDVYRVDTLGQVWFAQALARPLAARHGSMVLMSSSAGLGGDHAGLPFALAKGANVALVKSLARLLAPRVRVNGVAPGALSTSWLDELTPAQRRRERDRALLRRFGAPEEVAEVIVELALGGARFRTGQILSLDGGLLA
jgi:3-oxoacyl-[acyl-carrier protein] reductase